MLTANDIRAAIDTWAHSRLEHHVYLEADLIRPLPQHGHASTAFYSPLRSSSWGTISFLVGSTSEPRRCRNAQFASLFIDPYREWESSRAITTVSALSLAPLKLIAARLWKSLDGAPSAEQLIGQPNAWPRAPLNLQTTISQDISAHGLVSFLTLRGQDQALHTTLTAPLWTLPFRGLPFVVDFQSIPNAVAYVFYGIELVRNVIAGRALQYGARRRRHRVILSSALLRVTKLVSRFSKAILFQHQRRSPTSADADAPKASPSLYHREEIAEDVLGGRMLNVHPGKFSIRRDRLVRSQSLCDLKYRNRCDSVCSDAREKGVDRVARYSRSVA
jgi:hypothetical protein